ncbi:hypothetical protein T459_28701 [Capsicum annuum]|uniref:WAT1-related protein n=1 Tax=Capsicum annuum TaxID=4072 RepID=A0A2G2YHI6_CAPAN|nr:hypothetical protein T459_28701 [Capsicum annuum]
MNLLSKAAMNNGMSPYVHVAYRQTTAALVMCPIAYLTERKTRPNMTLAILFKIFLCSILGGSINQITYVVGLKHCNTTVASALTNLTPAFTFILAVLTRHEIVSFRRRAGIAKILGTLLSIGGAMMLSVYHGPIVPIGQPKIHWTFLEDITANKSSTGQHNYLGPLLVVTSALSWSIWSIVQTKVNLEYAATYSSTALMCLMSSCICLVIGFIIDHDKSDWSLTSSGIRAISSVYSGVFCSALSYFVMSCWLLLGEKIFTGTVVGSSLIILGLFTVLWGNWFESKQGKVSPVEHLESRKEDLTKASPV